MDPNDSMEGLLKASIIIIKQEKLIAMLRQENRLLKAEVRALLAHDDFDLDCDRVPALLRPQA